MDTPPPAIPPLSTPPNPSPISPDERQWKVILHLSALLGLVTPSCGNIIGPLIVWLIKKQDLPALDAEGRKVLNFQISYTIYMIIAGATVCIWIGWVLLPLIFILWLVFTIIGAVKVSNGEPYEFPFTIRML